MLELTYLEAPVHLASSDGSCGAAAPGAACIKRLARDMVWVGCRVGRWKDVQVYNGPGSRYERYSLAGTKLAGQCQFSMSVFRYRKFVTLLDIQVTSAARIHTHATLIRRSAHSDIIYDTLLTVVLRRSAAVKDTAGQGKHAHKLHRRSRPLH